MTTLALRSVALVFIMLGLSGCATAVLDRELPKYRGLLIDDLIGKLGVPAGENQVAGYRYVYWINQQSGITSIPQYNTATVNSYGSGGYSTGTVGYTTYMPVSYNHSCIIKAVIDKDRRIEKTEFEANPAGCKPFARRLEYSQP